jgi:hypothetical protein
MAKSSKSKVGEFLAKDAEVETATELRARVRSLERQVRGLRTKESTIVDVVRAALGESPPVLRAPPAPKRQKGGKYEEVAVLHISDTQCGKITRSYDTQVCEARVLKCVEKAAYIADLRRNIARIDELHLYLGGDMIEGEEIFPHQAHEIDSSVFEQAVVNFPRIAVKAILAALARFPKVKVFCVAGNHGRNGPRHTRAHPKTNWDTVSYEVSKALLLGSPEHPRKELADRLDFRIADEFWIVDRVFDWGNLMVHGHQIGGGFAGFPWYGAGKKAWGWIDTIEEKWDNLFFGHFHTAASATLNLRRFYANGTTESDNDFAKEQLAACGTPCQRLLFMDAKHGVVSDGLIQLAPVVPNSKR